jgi:NCS1 family nucleobase:cation symporter-1
MTAISESKVGRLVDKLAVESEPGLNHTQLMLTNHDLKPVEPERRQWGAWNYVGFWVADSFNINTWMISSSMITLYGLSWWQSWLCVWIGYTLSACFICLTGRIGATYHIGFPVVARSSFGIWGSLWPVFNRAAMACIWYGVQSWIGGNCVKIMISSIWKSFQTLPNTLGDPPTNDFVAFLIFWVLSLPAIWFPVHKIRHLFTVKAYVVPVVGVAFFGWAISRAGGLGPIVHQPSESKGSDLAWGMVKGIMSSIANFATLIVNDPDFARFARKPRDQLWSQLITIPIGFAVTSFIGIIVSSSSAVIYGDAVWNPLQLLERFLENASSGERFGIFVIGTGFALAQLGTNIAANSVSAGTDLTALVPRYINIRRGGYICALVGIVMCPWELLKTSNKFTTYLSAYSVFLSSVAGVMVCDYYWVRKGFLDIKDLYSGKSTGSYYFWHGFNWRGYAAYILGIAVNIVGFAGAVGATVPIGATYIYNVNYFAGFIVAAVSYKLFSHFFPIPALSPTGKWMEVGDDINDVRVAYGPDSDSDVERVGDYHKSAEGEDTYKQATRFRVEVKAGVQAFSME